MTTPAACVPTFRTVPSRRLENSIIRAMSGSRSASAFRAGSFLIASSSEMFRTFGTSFLIASTFGNGMPSARPTSVIAAFAFRVPKVPIWATFSDPYLSRTYSMTS